MATSVITAGNKREHRVGTGVLAGVVVALAAFVGFSNLQSEPVVVTPAVLTPIESNAPSVSDQTQGAGAATAYPHVKELERQAAAADSSDAVTLQEAIDAASASALADQGQQRRPGNVR